MNELATMLLGGIVDQLQGESLHVAFLAIVGGVSTASAVIGWLIRRDVRRSDKESAARDLRVATLDERLDRHIASSGMETQDIHINFCVLAAQVRHVIPEVEIPEWPSRQ